MPATVIPVKGILLGFVGNISNEGYSLRTAREVEPTDTLNVAFGETFVLNTDNTYSSVKSYLLKGAGSILGTTAVGIAASNVNINPTYNTVGTNDVLTPGGVYTPGSMMDGLVQGTINVSCNAGTPVAGGPVWMRVAPNAAVPNGVVGGLEAVADPNPVSATTLTTTSGSANATVSSGTGLSAGMQIVNANVPAGTFIKSIAGTAVVLSVNASASGSAAAATFSNSILMPNFAWKTGYLETDLTCQVTILARQIA
jgi:hypothetical protein